METCQVCGKEIAVGEWPCITRVREHGVPNLIMVGDEWPGGGARTFENIDSVPRTFDNKSDWKRFMASRGLVNRVEHKPVPGSDRSPHTQRFV